MIPVAKGEASAAEGGGPGPPETKLWERGCNPAMRVPSTRLGWLAAPFHVCLEENAMRIALVATYTYPGTPLYDRARAEGLIGARHESAYQFTYTGRTRILGSGYLISGYVLS